MVLLYQRCLFNLHSIHLITASSLVNLMKLRGHAPLSIWRTNPDEKTSSPVEISLPVGYVIGLTHHSPWSILRTKPRKCFVYSADETILPNHNNFHMATRDSPCHHVGGMQTIFISIFQFHFQFVVLSHFSFQFLFL